MVRILFTSILFVSVLSACSNPASSVPGPGGAPAPHSTDKPIPLTASAGRSSTAPPLSAQPEVIEYSSVAEALAALKTRPAVSIEVLQGWTIATEPDGSTTWAFAPPDHPAFPAVAKRVLYRDQDGWHLKMDVLCEAEPAVCDQFVRHFEALNEPIYQFIEQQQEP